MRKFNSSAPFAQKWRLRAVSRAFHCAWHTKHAWRGTRWHLTLRRTDYGHSGPGPSLTAEWIALLRHIAHVLPDGLVDSLERACQPQFHSLPIDEALNEVRSFGECVYVETFDVLPQPDGPFVTHLLHDARHVSVQVPVRHGRNPHESRVPFRYRRSNAMSATLSYGAFFGLTGRHARAARLTIATHRLTVACRKCAVSKSKLAPHASTRSSSVCR